MQRMPLLHPSNKPLKKTDKRSQRWIIVGACLLSVLSAILLYFVITGNTRRQTADPFVPTTTNTTTTQDGRAVRKLDGVLVSPGSEAARPVSVMIDNQIAAQPWSGVEQASLVIESPVEGGITRLMAFFDPSIPTSTQIGPVRSARPYFLDWATAWEAGYAHVGGSPEALERIKRLGNAFFNIDEMANGAAFYRDRTKVAPHNIYTSIDRLTQVMERRYGTSTATYANWRFEPLATSTNDVIAVSSIRIPYGGSYSITWKYDPQLGLYRRMKGNVIQKTREGNELLAANIAVIKTDAQVLDAAGRLALRTTGGGDAILYRAGKKYVARWSRSQNELIRFEGADGTQYPLTAGTTWIQVTTDDRVFGGLMPTAPATAVTSSTP